MSGGSGGGIIIIRSLREMAETEFVRGCNNTKRLDAILQKPDRDWSKRDMNYVLNCAAKAVKST